MRAFMRAGPHGRVIIGHVLLRLAASVSLGLVDVTTKRTIVHCRPVSSPAHVNLKKPTHGPSFFSVYAKRPMLLLKHHQALAMAKQL